MIYFIEAKEQKLIKIGFSASNHEGRFSAIQMCSPVKLDRLALMDGGMAFEERLHGHFGGAWSHGEWFRDNPRLRAFIEADAQPWVNDKYRKIFRTPEEQSEGIRREELAIKAERRRLAAERLARKVKKKLKVTAVKDRYPMFPASERTNSFDLKKFR